jgi:hypothetical protein
MNEESSQIDVSPQTEEVSLEEESRHRQLFYNQLIKLNEDGKLNKFFNKETYEDAIRTIERGGEGLKDSVEKNRYYYLSRKYQVLKIGNVQRLVKKSDEKTDISYLAYEEEMFDILQAAHKLVGHGGVHKTKKQSSLKYDNITREIINLFNSLCEACIRKNTKKGYKNSVVKPIVSEDFLSRCQVDLIDMQSCKDGPWNWIMNYQDHHSKFCILKPLTQKCGKEVAANLIEICLTFGAPLILQSDNGREFVNQVIQELMLMWPTLKLVNSRPRHPQSQGSVERSNQDIENMITSWCSDNKTPKWSRALMFVQYSKNVSHHSGIGMSPFKAMFGCSQKVGLSSTKLPEEIIETISTEEDLLETLRNSNVIIVPIPDVDKGPLDPNHFLCCVVVVNNDKKLYQLGNKHGLLGIWLPINGFGVVRQNLIDINDVNHSKTIGIREMARACSTGTGQGYIKCSCKGACDKKCNCKIKNKFAIVGVMVKSPMLSVQIINFFYIIDNLTILKFYIL